MRASRHRVLTLAGAAVLAAGVPRALSGQAAAPTGLACREVPGWPRLPAGDTLGMVSGVAVDPAGRVVAFRRAGRVWDSDTLDATPIARPTVLVLDAATGAVVRAWGAGRFAMPHGLTVDRRGHVWLTDVALHQVYEFSATGRLLRTVGERAVPGRDAAHFDMPSGVAVAADGSFYVSDGYGNTRVLHFAADGRLLRQWGDPGAGPGQFDLVHGVTLGPGRRVYVADRENARVQLFDATGRFVAQWKSDALGKPFAVARGPAGTRWSGTWLVADGGRSGYATDPRATSGVAVVGPDGAVRARFAEVGRDATAPLRPHALAVGPDGAVYVAGLRLAKFVCRGVVPHVPAER
jgi:peptidylamidoglycolate lyase